MLSDSLFNFISIVLDYGKQWYLISFFASQTILSRSLLYLWLSHTLAQTSGELSCLFPAGSEHTVAPWLAHGHIPWMGLMTSWNKGMHRCGMCPRSASWRGPFRSALSSWGPYCLLSLGLFCCWTNGLPGFVCWRCASEFLIRGSARCGSRLWTGHCKLLMGQEIVSSLSWNVSSGETSWSRIGRRLVLITLIWQIDLLCHPCQKCWAVYPFDFWLAYATSSWQPASEQW